MIEGIVAETIRKNGRVPNSWDVERIGQAVVPKLAAALHEETSPNDVRRVLAEAIALLGLLCGVAADGSRTAFSLTPDTSGR
jgi:hypothetical protein